MRLSWRERLHWIAIGKQPAPMAAPPSTGAQKFEQIPGEQEIAVLEALALLDTDVHARAVDVGDLACGHLRRALSHAIGIAEFTCATIVDGPALRA